MHRDVLSAKSFGARTNLPPWWNMADTKETAVKALCQSGRPTDHCENPPQRKPQLGSAIISGYWWITNSMEVGVNLLECRRRKPPKKCNETLPHFCHILSLKHDERFNSPIGIKCDFIWNSFPFKSRQTDNFVKQDFFYLMPPCQLINLLRNAFSADPAWSFVADRMTV